MSNPTTPFSWQMPTATDLVTDLPADFEVFGQAVATSMQDLLGGTTGQILAKASATDMDFTWITNDVGDITAVTAGTGITGGGTSGAVTVSFDQANFGGGQNAAGKNTLLNGNLGIWSRGTTFTGASPYYAADRWQMYRAGAAADATFSRQSASLDGFDYCARLQRNVGTTGTSYLRIGTSYETSQVKSLWGKPLTASFWVRAGANFSAASGQILTEIHGGTGTDGSLGGGFTGRTTLASLTQTITTSWTRYSYNLASLSNTYTQLGFSIQFTPVGTAGAADYIEVTGLQLEPTTTVSPFQTATGSIQGELAACQRYYVRLGAANGLTTAAYATYGNGYTTSTTNATIPVQLPVTMRISPTSVDYSGLGIINTSSTLIAVSAVAINSSNNSNNRAHVEATTTGATANVYQTLENNNSTSGYIGFSAEL